MKLTKHVISEKRELYSFSVETDCGLSVWLSGVDDVIEFSDNNGEDVTIFHVDRIPAIIEALTALQNARTKI